MSLENFVAVDIGASDTRFATQNKAVYHIPNNMTFVPFDANIEMDTQDRDIERNLDISISRSPVSEDVKNIIENGEEFYPMHVLIGEVSDRYDSVDIRPNSDSGKIKQRCNHASCITAVALSKLRNPNMGNNIDLFIALPPSEIKGFKNAIKKYMIGHYTVVFNRMTDPIQRVVEFDIENVYCFEESRMAMISYISSNTDKMANFANTVMLSIDIGASTTDFVIFKNRVYMDKSGLTVAIGCNTLKEKLVQIMRTKGISVSGDSVDMMVREGRFQDGAKRVADPDTVSEAKRQVADMIVNAFGSHLTLCGLTPRDVAYIIVSGGGSMQSGYIDDSGEFKSTSGPMSEYITEHMKRLSPNSEVIPISDEPRLANIKGLVMMACAKLEQEKRKSQTVS